MYQAFKFLLNFVASHSCTTTILLSLITTIIIISYLRHSKIILSFYSTHESSRRDERWVEKFQEPGSTFRRNVLCMSTIIRHAMECLVSSPCFSVIPPLCTPWFHFIFCHRVTEFNTEDTKTHNSQLITLNFLSSQQMLSPYLYPLLPDLPQICC
jgi:hypothetical protein